MYVHKIPLFTSKRSTMAESFTYGNGQIPLYPGESICRFCPCTITYAQMDFVGDGLLFITNFKLHFKGEAQDEVGWSSCLIDTQRL